MRVMMRLSYFAVILIGGMLLATGCIESTGSEQSLSELERLKAENQRLKQQLQQQNARTEKRPPVRQVRQQKIAARALNTRAPVMGDAQAPVVILEYTDYECSYCVRFSKQTLPQLRERYIDSGKARLYLKDFPLNFHPNARSAAIAARCAGEQGQYWPMHDALFASTKGVGERAVEQFAQQLGLDGQAFDECRTREDWQRILARDFAEGRRLGVSGTPAFFIGRLDKKGGLLGEMLVGARPYEDFQRVIDKYLAQ